MPYQYYNNQGLQGLRGGGYQPQQQSLNYNPYGQQQQKQESPFSQIKPQNIKSAYDMYTAGGLSGAGGGGGVAALSSTGGAAGVAGGSMGPVAGLAASEAAAGTGGSAYLAGSGGAAAGGSAGGSMASGAAAAGPWAALAAIIMVNEYNAEKGGYRDENKGQYAKDLATGAVANQDMQKRWLPKLGLDEDSSANKYVSMGLNPVGYAMDKWF